MSKYNFTSRQLLFKELFVGTLIYAVVLGFFDDYWHLVYAESFSVLFFAAFVLEILTYLTLWSKKKIIASLKGREGWAVKVAMFFTVWFIMFISKFVFLWAIDGIFGDAVNIYGFVAILVLAVSVTVIHKLADYTFIALGKDVEKS